MKINFLREFSQLFKGLSGVERILAGGWLLIILLLPFHAFISTWGGSQLGFLEVWKAWKEFFLFGLLILALFYLIKNNYLKEFFKSKLVILIFVYLILHLLYIAILKPDMQAALVALLFNFRFLGILLLSMVLTRFVDKNLLLKLTLKIVLVSSLTVVIFAILQVLLLPKDLLANFGYSLSTIAPYTTLNDDESIVRAMSTLRGPNTLGQYLVLILIILIAIFTQVKRWWVGSLMILTILAMYLTHSRSAWLGMVIAVSIYLWISINDQIIRRRVFISAAIGASFMLVALIAVLPNSPMLQNIIFHTELSDDSESSTDAHASALENSFERVVNNPLGSGPGSAGPASFYGSQDPKIPENYYLQITEEVGLVGLVIFGLICFIVVYRLYLQREKMWPKILIATFAGVTIINLFLHGWADETMAMTWWAIAGLLMKE